MENMKGLSVLATLLFAALLRTAAKPIYPPKCDRAVPWSNPELDAVISISQCWSQNFTKCHKDVKTFTKTLTDLKRQTNKAIEVYTQTKNIKRCPQFSRESKRRYHIDLQAPHMPGNSLDIKPIVQFLYNIRAHIFIINQTQNQALWANEDFAGILSLLLKDLVTHNLMKTAPTEASTLEPDCQAAQTPDLCYLQAARGKVGVQQCQTYLTLTAVDEELGQLQEKLVCGRGSRKGPKKARARRTGNTGSHRRNRGGHKRGSNKRKDGNLDRKHRPRDNIRTDDQS